MLGFGWVRVGGLWFVRVLCLGVLGVERVRFGWVRVWGLGFGG